MITTEADGNGRLDAVSNALKKAYDMQYTLVSYTEHALEMSTSSKAIAIRGYPGNRMDPFPGVQASTATLSVHLSMP